MSPFKIQNDREPFFPACVSPRPVVRLAWVHGTDHTLSTGRYAIASIASTAQPRGAASVARSLPRGCADAAAPDPTAPAARPRPPSTHPLDPAQGSTPLIPLPPPRPPPP